MTDRSDAEAARAVLKLAVANNLITSDQARRANLEAEKARADPSEILLARGVLTAKAIANLRAEVDSRLGPKRIGGHRILSMLGRGGMGVVYRAEQKELHREVALKVLDESIARAEPGTAQRFLREATTMARIKDDHVVTVFDAGRDGDHAFIVMELVEGGDAERLRSQLGGRISPKRSLEIIRDAALGLAAIHDSNLVHRDIKPTNIFLTLRGKAKLADLGLSRDAARPNGTTTAHGQILGTPAYMSPEQARDDVVDIRTDIYALGATLYTLLTGRAPYVAANPVAIAMLAIRGPFPDPRQIVPILPAPVVELIRRATAHLPAERFQTPAEFVAAIEAVIADPQISRNAPSGEVAVAAPANAAATAAAGDEPWQPSWAALALLAAVVIALLVIGGWWYLQP
jgi:serine/threonine protein kinase